MKKALLLASLLLSSLLLSAQEWITYNNADFNFSVDVPSEPEPSSQEVETEIGLLTMNMFMIDNSADQSNNNMVYMIVHTSYPKNPEASDQDNTIQRMLDGSVAGAVNNVNGKLIYAKNVELNGYPGRETKISVMGAFMYINMYVKDNALYAIQTICMEAKDKNDDIAKFMHSFNL